MLRLSFLLIGICAFSTAAPALATDHWNLEEELPTEVEDAYASDYLTPEIQTLFRYEHIKDGGERFVLSPRLVYGFAREWQAKIAVPFFFGSADNRGSGSTGLEALHTLFHEEGLRPAVALAGGLALPTGLRSHGVDTLFKFIATKAFGQTFFDHRIHINAAWDHNTSPGSTDRRDRYMAILGYSHPIPAALVLVVDFAREQELARARTTNLAEAGIRQMLTTVSVLSLGAGIDVVRGPADFRITIGYQYSIE